MRPIAHAANKVVLHWIKVNIVDLPLEISVITNRMLPISTLPERRLSVSVTYDRSPGIHEPVRKSAFDEPPSVRIVRIPVRQRHDKVQMVRQHHDCIDRHRMREPCLPHGRPQGFDVLDQRPRGSIYERNGEEKRSACNEIPTVTDHVSMLSRL